MRIFQSASAAGSNMSSVVDRGKFCEYLDFEQLFRTNEDVTKESWSGN